MAAYRKFSDAQQGEVHAAAPPKPAKAQKAEAEAIKAEALGGLGGLGETELQSSNSATPVSALDRAAWGEAAEERAAIVEYDGGIPCGWAEGFARLDPTPRPATCR